MQLTAASRESLEAEAQELERVVYLAFRVRAEGALARAKTPEQSIRMRVAQTAAPGKAVCRARAKRRRPPAEPRARLQSRV